MSFIKRNDITDDSYHSHQLSWEKLASVRVKPRKIIEVDHYHDYYFPASRQPIVKHPIIDKMEDDAKQFLLLQSCYKFMHDVAMIETEVVNAGALLIANNRLDFKFPKSIQLDAFTVLIDESYHAYVAFDFLEQLIAITGIKPIDLPSTGPVISALHEMQQRFSPKIRDIFTVIAVCIGEHVLIKDIISVSKGKTVIKAFYDIMRDHLLDEGRHSKMFEKIMGMLWEGIDNDIKDLIGPQLIEYFRLNFANQHQMEFERMVLKKLNLSDCEIDQIFNDIYPKNNITLNNPVIVHIVNMLKNAGLFEHALTRHIFKKHELLLD